MNAPINRRKTRAREHLIAEGIIRPAADVAPAHVPSTGPVLRMDEDGRREAQRAITAGENGKRLCDYPQSFWQLWRQPRRTVPQ